jgi:hypothetical protein
MPHVTERAPKMGPTVPAAIAGALVAEVRRHDFDERLVGLVIRRRETGTVLAKVHEADRTIIIGEKSEGE